MTYYMVCRGGERGNVCALTPQRITSCKLFISCVILSASAWGRGRQNYLYPSDNINSSRFALSFKGTKSEKDMIEWAKRQSRRDEKDRQKKIKSLKEEEEKQLALALKKSLEESNA